MKTKLLLVSAAMLLLANAVSAQGKYGATPEDSVKCVQNLSLYRDYLKQGNVKDAHQFWAQALATCPSSSVNLYIQGTQIMRTLIENTTDSSLRKARIDTLLSLYDKRLEYFANSNRADIYDRKARDLMMYLPDDKDAVFAAFMKAVDEGREKTDPSTLLLTLSQAIDLYKAQKYPAEKVMELYTSVSQYIDAQIKVKPTDEKLLATKNDIDNLLATSGVASCDNLVALFTPRFQANPADKDLVITIVRLLGQSDCTNNPLYMQAAEAYHKMEPSAASAYALAKMNLAREDYTRSLECYRDAIKLTQGNDTISQYLLEMGTIYLRFMNDMPHAMSAARDAISKDPKNGKAYMLMGSIWAMQKCGSDDLERKAVFWVAVDFFQKAKQVDPSVADEATKSINTYSQYFPAQSEAFMYDLMDGASYTVNCSGMSERTTVRTRK